MKHKRVLKGLMILQKCISKNIESMERCVHDMQRNKLRKSQALDFGIYAIHTAAAATSTAVKEAAAATSTAVKEAAAASAVVTSTAVKKASASTAAVAMDADDDAAVAMDADDDAAVKRDTTTRHKSAAKKIKRDKRVCKKRSDDDDDDDDFVPNKKRKSSKGPKSTMQNTTSKGLKGADSESKSGNDANQDGGYSRSSFNEVESGGTKASPTNKVIGSDNEVESEDEAGAGPSNSVKHALPKRIVSFQLEDDKNMEGAATLGQPVHNPAKAQLPKFPPLSESDNSDNDDVELVS